ncbi:MAG: hypothetical protein HUU43_17060 [Ignavibacteriaceae bacterium]|nr:hypothetical protein [Ignavibacteriaceae bacterium]
MLTRQEWQAAGMASKNGKQEWQAARMVSSKNGKQQEWQAARKANRQEQQPCKKGKPQEW